MAAAIDPAARKRESIKATILGSQGSAATESVAFSSQGSSVSMPHGEISSSAKEMFKSSAQEQDLVLASTLVLDAKRGLHSDYEKTEKCVKRYLLYQHSGFKYALYVLLVVHHMVAVFEKPAVTGYELPYGATMAVEGLCLMFYLMRLVHAVSFLPLERFWRDKKNASQLVMILLTIIDMAVYIGLTESGHSAYAIRWSRLLRPLLFVNISENKQIRRAFRNIRKTLADIFRVLLLFYFFLGLFSLMALKLYDRKNLKNFDGSPYFNNYFDIFFNLYILVTTANNPDVMIPAYEDNRWSALFFIVYLVVCLYVFMNIILAVIYSNYRNNLKNEVLSMIQMRRDSLSQAFDILKEPSETEGEYVVSLPTFQALMRKVLPRASPVTINILWFLLGQSPDSITISKEEFFQLADLLNVGVSEYRKRETIFHRMCPKLYHSKVSIVFKKIVAHRFFRHAFDALILLNAFLIAWDRNEAEWFFLAIFTFEIAAKVYTFGAREFFSKMWNCFDTLIIGAAILTSIAESLAHEEDNVIHSLDFLLVLRVLRLIKVIGSIDTFKVIINTIIHVGPSILTYGGVLFVLYYQYAILGMELFNQKIHSSSPDEYCGNTRLNGSDFATSHYCTFNFNNLPSSFVVLFALMVVNQWHVISEGHVLVTSQAARLYFISFHILCVVIVLNIFTAFVLEAFLLQYSVTKSQLEFAIERKIEEMGLRKGHFQIGFCTPSHFKQFTRRCSEEISTFWLPRKSKSADSDPDPEDLVVDGDHDERMSPSQPGTDLPDLSQDTGVRFHIEKKKNVESLLLRMFEKELDLSKLHRNSISESPDGNYKSFI